MITLGLVGCQVSGFYGRVDSSQGPMGCDAV